MTKKETIKLRYLKDSKKKMGLALWDVLTPIEGYTYSIDNGFPTFSLEGLKERGLIKWF
jgi:hypothetical protein